MSKELESVKNKVAKLMALGTKNTSLEEANVALQRAGKLMEEWGLSINDIELGDTSIIHKEIDTGRRKSPETSGLYVLLAKFVNVKMWVCKANKYDKSSTYRINIIGYQQDVDMFVFFNRMLENAIEYSFERYKTSFEYKQAKRTAHGKAIRGSFNRGFVYTVNKTLEDLIEAQEDMTTSSGTALVPLKMGNIENFFEENFNIRLRKGYNSYRSNSHSANGYSAGSSAGSGIRFNTPVNNGGSVKLIG